MALIAQFSLCSRMTVPWIGAFWRNIHKDKNDSMVSLVVCMSCERCITPSFGLPLRLPDTCHAHTFSRIPFVQYYMLYDDISYNLVLDSIEIEPDTRCQFSQFSLAAIPLLSSLAYYLSKPPSLFRTSNRSHAAASSILLCKLTEGVFNNIKVWRTLHSIRELSLFCSFHFSLLLLTLTEIRIDLL